ncbi:MAG TPA: hypothetical protein VEK33_14470 [Terriglobales bacterium]|nr:hypothetical protein [Terriglobales bacterium]
MFHLNCVLNPFAIDSNSERERYLYLPLAFPEILHYKQTASAIMFAGSVSPLLLPLLWRLDLLGIVLVLLRLGLVTFNLLLTGIVLMRTDSAHSIRVLFWALRSNERILMLGFIAVFLDAAVPIVTMLITKDERPLLEVLSSVGILVLLIALLGTLCRRQTWASFRNTIAL